MFKTITTEWVFNPHPLLNNKRRFIGPAWVGWLIVQAEGKRIHTLLQRLAALAFRFSGAHYEIQDLTEFEIATKRMSIAFSKLLTDIIFMGRGPAHKSVFSAISEIVNTNSGMDHNALR
jgi:hypothetical protein